MLRRVILFSLAYYSAFTNTVVYAEKKQDPNVTSLSVSDIAAGLMDAKSELEEYFAYVAEELKKDPKTQGVGKKIEAFANNWFSYVGVYKGIPALASDFVWNYAGHKDFHDYNGNLVISLKSLVHHLASGKGGSKKDVAYSLRAFAQASFEIFDHGPLKEASLDLLEIITSETAALALVPKGSKGASIAKSLSFLVDPEGLKSSGTSEHKKKYSHLDVKEEL